MSSLETQDGRLMIFSGITRSGKTSKAVEVASRYGNTMVWDVEAQWCTRKGYTKIESLAELKKIALTGRKGKFCYVYQNDLKSEFETFCAIARHYGTFKGGCLVVVEELADVTGIGKAAHEWGMLLRKGLKRNITIIAISQRWQEADKTALSNASDFYVFMLNSESDRRYLSERSNIPVEKIAALVRLEYCHYDAWELVLVTDKLKFKGKK